MNEIKPLLKYPGAKWRLAPWIVSYLPTTCKHYLEPYCGSAAVFFSKPPAEHEILNDIHSSITTLFRVIRSRGEELARLIELTPWSEEEYHAIEECYVDADDLEHARKFLVRCWQAHGTATGKKSGFRHNGIRGKAYPVRVWNQLPERIMLVAARLKDAEIRNRPALEMIAYYNDPDCLIYADPPYILSTRLGSGHYAHEMTDEEHIALLNALEVHRGPVVLSGYDHPIYSRRLAHWHKVTTPLLIEHGYTRTESLWLNEKAAGMQQMRMFESEAAV